MAAHLQRRANGRVRARYRDPSGAERSRTFDRVTDARRFLEEVNAQLLRGEWVDPDDAKVTFAVYAERWIAVQPWREGTAASVRSRLNHILPTFGSRRIGTIRRTEVQAWLAGLDMAPSTREGTFRLLASILKAAAADRVIAVSPAVGVRLPRQEGRLLASPLTVAEVQGLADRIAPELSAAVIVAAMTGLRQGELFGLTEDRVRWLERALVVDRQLVTPPKGAPRFGPPKTARSSRTIPLADEVLPILSEQVRVYGVGADGLVFHDDGKPWRRQKAGRRMQEAGGDGWHPLRHHCASRLIAGGVPVTAVAAMLGHTPQECLETYAAWFPSEDDVLRGAISGAWGQSSNSTILGQSSSST